MLKQTARALPMIQSPKSPSPFLTTIILMLVDAASLVMAFEMSTRLWDLGQITTDKLFDLESTAVIGLFVLAYAISGLYPGVGIRPHEELKKLTIDTILMHVVFSGVTFFVQRCLEFPFTRSFVDFLPVGIDVCAARPHPNTRFLRPSLLVGCASADFGRG